MRDKAKPGKKKLARPQIIEASEASQLKDVPQDVGRELKKQLRK